MDKEKIKILVNPKMPKACKSLRRVTNDGYTEYCYYQLETLPLEGTLVTLAQSDERFVYKHGCKIPSWALFTFHNVMEAGKISDEINLQYYYKYLLDNRDICEQILYKTAFIKESLGGRTHNSLASYLSDQIFAAGFPESTRFVDVDGYDHYVFEKLKLSNKTQKKMFDDNGSVSFRLKNILGNNTNFYCDYDCLCLMGSDFPLSMALCDKDAPVIVKKSDGFNATVANKDLLFVIHPYEKLTLDGVVRPDLKIMKIIEDEIIAPVTAHKFVKR